MDKRFCIFDMDGTLVDSMPFWDALAADYLEQHGLHPTAEQLDAIDPLTMPETAAYFMEAFSIPGPPERIIREMEGVMEVHYRTDVPLKPGVREYLERLKARGARLCVATATAGPLARACLERLGVDKLFNFVLSCETLGVGKTRPDIFLEAARRLGAPPGEIAVFEDAPYAARTARAAGFYTVAVADAAFAGDWDTLSALAHETITDWRKAP